MDDERSARAWGHCTFPGCRATVSCGVNWQLDHVLITCFINKVHHHQRPPGCDRSAAQDLAATVSHKPPLRGSAELLTRMPAVPPCHLPTEKEHKRARRRFLQKQPKRMVATSHGALAWQQRLADKAAFNAQQMRDGFLFYPLCGLDDTCLPLRGWAQLPNLKVPEGSYVFMSRHMVEATRAYVAAGGVRSLKEGVLLGDFSWKSTYSGYATGLWAHASQHSYSAGTSSQHLPKSQAIPAAHQWAPKENIHAAAFGLITMISVYMKVWNIDLCTWFSAVILDGLSTGHATVQRVLPKGTLFGRDLPHQVRNNVKQISEPSIPHAKRGGRRPKPEWQEDRLQGVCNVGDQPAGSASGVRNAGDASAGSAPGSIRQAKARAEPSQKDRSPSCEQPPTSVQTAYAKANLQFVSLCCPTVLLESVAIETVMAQYMVTGLDNVAMTWQTQWVQRDEETGLWKSLCSSNLMSGFVPGYTPSSCFQAEERTNRSLKEGIPTNAHKTSADHVTDCLQASSTLAFYRPRSSSYCKCGHIFCMCLWM